MHVTRLPNRVFVELSDNPTATVSELWLPAVEVPYRTPTSPATALPTLHVATVLPAPVATLCAPAVRGATEVGLREGPDMDYPMIGILQVNTDAALIARSADAQWYEVVTPDGHQGWVWQASVISVCGSEVPKGLPIVHVPPVVETPQQPVVIVLPSAQPITQTPQRSLIQFWSDSASVVAGGCVSLYWVLENMESAFLDDGTTQIPVTQRGGVAKCPLGTTAYALNVTLDDDHTARQIITVGVTIATPELRELWLFATPTPPQPTASATPIRILVIPVMGQSPE